MSRRATAVLSFTAYLLGVIGAVIAHNTNDSLPLWIGIALAVTAAAGLCVFLGSIVHSARQAAKTEVDEDVAPALITTCVVATVASPSWSLLEAFAGAPRPTGA